MIAVPTLVGIDTGGTFTDLIAFHHGALRTHKVLSTPQNPAIAVLRGLQELLPDHVPERLTYSTTVATNALLERKGARVLLLTTAGFEDVIEIGRQDRPELYALEPRRPAPLVPRPRRVGVHERMLYDGSVLVALRHTVLRDAIRTVRRHQPQAVAVCFLHAYANPRHEQLVGKALAQFGDLFCSLSHELVAEYREYERLSTTVINAYVGPVMSQHLGELQRGLAGTQLRVLQSNGGAISAPVAAREAVRTCLSGPAGGVIGAWSVARSLRLSHVITFDMGGTSTDVSVVNGAVRFSTEWQIGGLPVKIPSIDIHTVGAGGGSIAQVDAGGALKVGPESAGADPGPACYGKGSAATVTDANLLLGRLVAPAFLGGRMRLQRECAAAAVQRLARQLHMPTESAAEGVVRVVNATMERAIRRVTVERGHDPRTYTLIAFGGAAAQHACEVGAALGIRRVVVPQHPGLLSAWGTATANVQRDYVRTVRMTNPSAAAVRRHLAPLQRSARIDLRAQGIAPTSMQIVPSVDVRYAGQSHEIIIPFDASFIDAFHAAHRRLYGYADRDRRVEVVNVRVLATGKNNAPSSRALRPAAPRPPTAQRLRWAERWRRATVRARDHLPLGAAVRGPALIAEFSATTVVPPGWRATVHKTGHLVLSYGR